MVGLCNSTTAHVQKQMPKQGVCDICKLVVNFLQPYVDNNSTEVRELDMLLNVVVCSPNLYAIKPKVLLFPLLILLPGVLIMCA